MEENSAFQLPTLPPMDPAHAAMFEQIFSAKLQEALQAQNSKQLQEIDQRWEANQQALKEQHDAELNARQQALKEQHETEMNARLKAAEEAMGAMWTEKRTEYEREWHEREFTLQQREDFLQTRIQALEAQLAKVAETASARTRAQQLEEAAQTPVYPPLPQSPPTPRRQSSRLSSKSTEPSHMEDLSISAVRTTPKKPVTPRKPTPHQPPSGPDTPKTQQREQAHAGVYDVTMNDGEEEEGLEMDEEDEEQEGGGVEKKERRQTYQLKKKDLPEDLGGLKRALEFHLRLLWLLLTGKAIPTDPEEAILHAFRSHFKTKKAVLTQNASGKILLSVKKVLGAAHLRKISSRSKIVQHTRKMDETLILYIDTRIAMFGLSKWCPDLRQSAYSVYNQACRLIALETFRHAVRSHAYAEFAPNLAYVDDMEFLIRLYDHIVHHYHFSRYMRDINSPGVVQESEENNAAYRSRQRLGDARLAYMQLNSYDPLLFALAEHAATSDDEEDPRERNMYNIRRRPERSAAANAFIRDFDTVRERNTRLDQSKRWRERKRRVPSDQKNTTFPTLPKDMPIDYFDPDFYNSLEVGLRTRIATPEVALLRYEPPSTTREQVLARYNIPEDGHAADMTQNELEEERRSLSAHMSIAHI